MDNKEPQSQNKVHGPPATLPVISLWQPWATWILWGWKTIETRTHDRFRGLTGKRIGIHAAQKIDHDWRLLAGRYLGADRLQKTAQFKHARGALICTVQVEYHARVGHLNSPEALIECETPRYGLFLTQAEVIEPPIPMRGRQGIWSISWPALEPSHAIGVVSVSAEKKVAL